MARLLIACACVLTVAAAPEVAGARVQPGDAAKAITLACHVGGITPGACQSFFRVAWCESRMDPNAQSGQYKGLFQLGARHRTDPLIRMLGWSDPYANALHTVRYVLAHGWGEWQCMPTGGLRW